MEEFIRPRSLNVQMLNKWLVVLCSANLWTLSEVGEAALTLVKVPMLAFPAHFLSPTCSQSPVYPLFCHLTLRLDRKPLGM